MELKNELLKFFDKKGIRNKKYSFGDIRRGLSYIDGIKNKDINDALNSLELEGEVFITDLSNGKKMYSLFPKDLGYVQERISINKYGDGYIEQDGKRYKVKSDDLNGALDQDLVVVVPTNKKDHGYSLAKVKKIIKRKNGLIVCEVRNDGRKLYLEPFSAKLNGKVYIPSSLMNNYVDGDRIQVRIDTINKANRSYEAKIVKYVGHKDDPNAEIKMIAIQNNIPIVFSFYYLFYFSQ